MPPPLATLSWTEPDAGGSVRQDLDSAADLIEAVNARYRSPIPVIGRITRAAGDSLLIGLGRPFLATSIDDEEFTATSDDRTFIAYEAPDARPPYLSARTDQPGNDDLVWFADGSWTEIPARSGLALSHGLEIVLEFLVRDGLPTRASWGED